MRQRSEQEWVDELDQVAVATTTAMLDKGGFVPPPTVHLLCAGSGSLTYAGYVQSRSFYPGDDARTAIEALGLMASAVEASRLVVLWEQADLQVALRQPGRARPSGLVVLDAPRAGEHVVRWHPVEVAQTGRSADGMPVVCATWGRCQQVPRARLPEPVGRLLQQWRTTRTWSDAELMNTYLDLEDMGYRMRWTQPPDDTPLEEWPRWRRVVEAVLAAQVQPSA